MTAASTGAPDPDTDRLGSLARRQARKTMSKLPLLGTVSWLMLAGAATRHTLLSDLEWRVMPALMLRQAKIYLRAETPVAFASWAYLSPQVAQRFRQPPHRLAPAEWNSGEQVWLVDLLAPFGGSQDVLKDLRKNVLRGQPLHQLVLGNDPQPEVFVWPSFPQSS